VLSKNRINTNIWHIFMANTIVDSRNLKLTPYREAPALNVSLNASAAKVAYPPADLPVIQRRCPSTLPLSTLI